MRPWEQERREPDATTFIPRDRGVPPGVRWPAADPDMLRPYDEFATRMLPRILDAPRPSEPIGDRLPAVGLEPERKPKAEPGGAKAPSLVKASGRMAIATLTSRITGFAWKVMLAWVAGISVVYDSFTVANTLPLIINELLLGGVLTSVVVPLLVRSQDDEDGGEAYTQRLLTMAVTVLLVGTVVSTMCAPLLTGLLMSDSGNANQEMATAFAYLLLPGLLFYGLFAVLSAILNAKQIFGPAQWAPVVNNLVIFVTIGLYALVPGDPTLNPNYMSQPKILVLGLGVLTAMVAQALFLFPALRRSGFRFRWRWGIDERLKEFGGLAAWILGYVVVSQVGMVINTRVLSGGDEGGITTYSNAWLLFQLPYGVIGVSLLTAVMPRMSRAAADGDTRRLVGDLSYASRLTTLTLLPISAVMAVAGTSIGIALFSFGEVEFAKAERLGQTLAISAFGLLPYALVMLQMRVFYAMKDSRTPTLIMVVMTAVKIPLLYLAAATLDPVNVVLGVMMVNSLVFVVGAVLGQVWLWVQLGNLRSRRVIGVILFTVVASGLGVLAAWLVGLLVPDAVGPVPQAWIRLVLQGTVGIAVSFGVLIALRVDELAPLTKRVTGLLRRA
ncbi:putative peptidoglycan lipid II flippase [Amycolatopsis arida]|uniref:Putative peptidoglycan lipid II flippase n=1 Tax=Amycolatopsis arida TaxID=587909 RepID=A0A1I5TST2_9PSEU|nr:murein biosynthesis integral membrane protein MurJ [Amycolatopsis arida]TDX96004.1 putative peptidoglycan lipid II flippase [Amycolatopsis arida]SFP85386.1 putative peptidoglycan lipid II flippase [Amycolatopsis arida]